jgi:hypothetical protein
LTCVLPGTPPIRDFGFSGHRVSFVALLLGWPGIAAWHSGRVH